jgi:hypothetical protein
MFSSVLGSTTTPLQSTLFRSVIIATKATAKPSLAVVRDILRQGWQPYEREIRSLDPEDQEFFLAPREDGKSDFDSKTYADTKRQLGWRLKDLTDRALVLRGTLRSTETKIDLQSLIDEGNILIINAKTNVLGDMGSEFWQRLWIALLLNAARARKTKLPCYVYIDEAHTGIARDQKIAKILDECRSAHIGMIISHQRMSQITDKGVEDALANCAIRMANSDLDAAQLAPRLRTTTKHLESLSVGSFAAFVRDKTPEAVTLNVVRTNPADLPQLTSTEEQSLRDAMRARYSSSPEAEVAPPAASNTTEDGDTSAQKWG